MLPKVVRCDELPPKVELSVNVNEVSGPGTEINIFPPGELLPTLKSLVFRKGPLVVVVPTDVPSPITLEPIGTV